MSRFRSPYRSIWRWSGSNDIRRSEPFTRHIGLIIGLVALIVALSIASDRFFDARNLVNIVRQASINGIIAIGMTFVVLTSGIDLSVGSMVALTAIVQAMLLKAGWAVPIIICCGLLLGALLGLANGALVTHIGIPPFVATLGTMVLLRGVTLIISGGRPLTGFPAGFRILGTGELGPVPVPVLVVIILYGIGIVVLGHTVVGERIYAIGDNATAARFADIAINRYTALAYIISGLMCTIAGILLIGRLDSAQPVIGAGYEFDAIAAVVIGGVSLAGGVGRLGGVVMGVLIIAIINNGLNLLNISSFYQQIVKGSVIALSLLVHSALQRGR